MEQLSPNSLFNLQGCTAFISGAGGHLGSVMARALGGAGAHIILNGRTEKSLRNLAETLPSAEIAVFDVLDVPFLRAFFAARPRLDVIINNAISMTPTPRDQLQPEDFDQTFRSSVTASFEIARAALPALRQAVRLRGDASIINIASMYGAVSPDARLYSRPEQSSPFHYGPAKAALLQLTRHLAADFGPEKIRVNALVPGPFPRPSIQQDDPAFAERLAGRTMLNRLGQASEIAGPALFLASPASSYVTGCALPIDGGWTAW